MFSGLYGANRNLNPRHRGLNHVWLHGCHLAIPLQRGFLYLVAVRWIGRVDKVLSLAPVQHAHRSPDQQGWLRCP